MTYEQIRSDEAIKTYITQADESLCALGYTEHSFAHVSHVAEQTGRILETMGFSPRLAELGRIAGYLHDIGNLVNRVEHSQSGALIAFSLLERHGFPPSEVAMITTAIGNHDEGTGEPVNDLSAALILADKADVRRSRVRNTDVSTFDIHDRVNYSVTASGLQIAPDRKSILLSLSVDTSISPVMDYFEIFLERMILCRKAANRLGLQFKLEINGQTLL